MTSIIDSLIEQQERGWSERLTGIRRAEAGALTWDRDPLEPEAAFLARVRAEAAEAGHRTVTIRGWIKV
jgi:hypothetical protein